MGMAVHHLDVKFSIFNGDLWKKSMLQQSDRIYSTKEIQGKFPSSLRSYGMAYASTTSLEYEKLSKTLKSLALRNVISNKQFTRREARLLYLYDLGLSAITLGRDVTQTGGEITNQAEGYINKIFEETIMRESNDTNIQWIPEGTKYLLHIRPDLSYSVRLLSRFMQDPKDHHLKAVKQVIRYIKGTKEHGIIYKKEGGCRITGYSNSSYRIKRIRKRKTTELYSLFLENTFLTGYTQKQPTVALSSCESEFMAATRAACQALWLKRLLSEITGWEEERITLKVYNISAIALVRNPVFYGRSKHIDIRYHFIRECVENGHINVEHVSGELQRADILTKALPRLKFEVLCRLGQNYTECFDEPGSKSLPGGCLGYLIISVVESSGWIPVSDHYPECHEEEKDIDFTLEFSWDTIKGKLTESITKIENGTKLENFVMESGETAKQLSSLSCIAWVLEITLIEHLHSSPINLTENHLRSSSKNLAKTTQGWPSGKMNKTSSSLEPVVLNCLNCGARVKSAVNVKVVFDAGIEVIQLILARKEDDNMPGFAFCLHEK
ncbi:hypothetical protein Tco_0726768 [Tanacetum coccineum]|uniref:Zinc finger, CCHC-type n=1 Tax=Tanacetum coccineum TaxID=301880 RepID=A0ABQ4YJ06_9ASTR